MTGVASGASQPQVVLTGIGWDGATCDVDIGDGRVLGRRHSAASYSEPEWIAMPPLHNWHCHLDKSLSGERWVSRSADRDVLTIASAEPGLRRSLTRSGADRAADLLRSMVAAGTAAVRSHVDIGPAYGLQSLADVRAACQRFGDAVECELVAFPQQGMRAPETKALLAEALGSGAHLMGGLDPGGFDGDIDAGLELIFDLATEADVPIDIHLHDHGDIGLQTIRRVAELTIQSGWTGRVAVSHALVLGELDASSLAAVADQLAQAQIRIISGVIPEEPPPPVGTLLEAGVPVGIGSDNIADFWSPFGSPDVLAKARALAERTGWTDDERLARAATLAQTRAHLPGPGEPADFLLVRARHVSEAVARCPSARLLLRHGRPVAGTRGGRRQWQKWTGQALDNLIGTQGCDDD